MSDLVKVKILKSIGHYTAGQDVEVSKEVAAQLCAVREKNDGVNLVQFQCAITFEDLKKAQEMHVLNGGLSLDEARALGVKKPSVPPEVAAGPIAPHLPPLPEKKEESLASQEKASFTEDKSPDEGKSAKAAMELNAATAKKKGGH
jgi:hypothetical protein